MRSKYALFLSNAQEKNENGHNRVDSGEALAKPLGILETGGCRRLGALRHFSDSGDFAGLKGECARAKGLRGLREAETLRFRACSGGPACDAGLSESHLPFHAANRAT